MNVLGDRGGCDLARGQPNPVVDDFEAGVAGPDGNLLGAIGVSIEAWLTDEEAQPRAKCVASFLYAPPHGSEPLTAPAAHGHSAEPRRRAIVAEDVAQTLRPLPRRHPGSGTG